MIFLGVIFFASLINKLLMKNLKCSSSLLELYHHPIYLFPLHRGTDHPSLSTHHISRMVPLTQAFWKRCRLWLFVSVFLQNSPTLSNCFFSWENISTIIFFFLLLMLHWQTLPNSHLRGARVTSLSTQSHPLSDLKIIRYAHSYLYFSGEVYNTHSSSKNILCPAHWPST